MKNLNYNLRTLASFFASHLLDKFGNKIKNIFLFGSVARGEANNESDLDIFVDLIEIDKTKFNKIKSEIQASVRDFEDTTSCKFFRAMRVNNTINVLADRLDDGQWEDLRLAIAAEGVILYGRGLALIDRKGQPHLLAWWTGPRSQRRKVEFLRQIYGRKEGGRVYPGLLQKWNGLKVGRGTILVPIKFRQELMILLVKQRIKYQVKSIWL